MVRHAQSVWNAEGRWQGQADPDLSPAGEEQAHRAAAALASFPPYDLVVSSDLARARHTAEILAGDLGVAGPVAEVTALREYDVGEWSGLTRDQIDQRWPGLLIAFSERKLAAAPGGERRADFDQRVQLAAQEVAGLAHARHAARVLIVAHGGVVRSLARAAGLPEGGATHLAGYEGLVQEATLAPERSVDLLASAEPDSLEPISL